MRDTKELRPWNVKPGDMILTAAFPFENHGKPTTWRTVRMVEPGRGFMSGERCWTIYGPQEGYSDGRIGTYYRDERLTVRREGDS